jgi:hypothetical protein
MAQQLVNQMILGAECAGDVERAGNKPSSGTTVREKSSSA